MPNDSEAYVAVVETNEMEFMGSVINVKKSKPQPPIGRKQWYLIDLQIIMKYKYFLYFVLSFYKKFVILQSLNAMVW